MTPEPCIVCGHPVDDSGSLWRVTNPAGDPLNPDMFGFLCEICAVVVANEGQDVYSIKEIRAQDRADRN